MHILQFLHYLHFMIYKWKQFSGINEDYINLGKGIPVEKYPVSNIYLLTKDLSEFAKPFIKTYSELYVPSYNESLLKSFLNEIGFQDEINSFRILGCSIQEKYALDYNYQLNNGNQDRDKDFGSYKKDYSSFLDWLGKYLEEDKDAFKNILFRNTEGNLSIKNTFLIDDVYGILNSHFSLSKENFEVRKEEIIKEVSSFKVDKSTERIKKKFILCLYQFFNSKFTIKTQCLRYVGVILHIFSVPTNNSDGYIELSDNINDLMESVDVNNLLHYITRSTNL